MSLINFGRVHHSKASPEPEARNTGRRETRHELEDTIK